MRVERDSLGEVNVPEDRYWGAQTERSRQNFTIGNERFGREVIWALGLVKRACAEVNLAFGRLDSSRAQAIIAAAEEVAEGKLDEHFPLVVWQTGSGTQTNMNANEVIAYRANALLGARAGAEDSVHPNDHVNLSQSSNDVFPTVMHLAASQLIETRLIPAVTALRDSFEAKAKAFADVIKIGRTHLQDATPLTLGQELSAYAAQLDSGLRVLTSSLGFVNELALGGTAVGTGMGSPPGFGEAAAHRLAELTGRPLVSAPNKFAALAGHEAMLIVSSACKVLAASLMKIANDLKLLASGPRCGLGELLLPENEPGSSIMPGKVNPTQAEALTMVCAQVMANDAAITMGAASGQLELNVFKPLIAHNLLDSVRLLADGCDSFNRRLVQGLMPNRERIQTYVGNSLMLVTALSPVIGYDGAARIARLAHEKGTSLREAALASGLVDAKTFDDVVRPELMIGPRS